MSNYPVEPILLKLHIPFGVGLNIKLLLTFFAFTIYSIFYFYKLFISKFNVALKNKAKLI